MVLRWLINGHRGSALQLNLLQHLKHLPHYMCCSHRNPKLFIVTDNHLELRTLFFQNVLTRHLEPDQTSTLRTRGSICDAFVWHRVLAESTRKGTDKYKFAQHGFISNKYLRYDIWKLVNLCVCIQRGSKREHPPGDKCMSACTTWDHMQKFIMGNAGNTSKNHVVINIVIPMNILSNLFTGA